jgi:hypothetical protein
VVVETRRERTPLESFSDTGDSNPIIVRWLGICLHRIEDFRKNFIFANNYFSMTSSSRASLAFAFYAYIPAVKIAYQHTSQLSETPAISFPKSQISSHVQPQNLPKPNYSSYAATKRKREDSPFCEMIKKQRNAIIADNDWEMRDA